jgi:predicted nucleotidyltransferase
MGTIQELATELGAEERTLRRAASQGTMHCRRPGPRRLLLASGEREYLRRHWELLAKLRRELRTERRVELAVLYGSVARGDEDGGSDLDLLVSFAGDRPADQRALALRLERVVGRRVDIGNLDRVEASAPLLLDRVLDEGRVLVDRGECWRRLRDRRRAVRARARRSHRRQMEGARQALAELSR